MYFEQQKKNKKLCGGRGEFCVTVQNMHFANLERQGGTQKSVADLGFLFL